MRLASWGAGLALAALACLGCGGDQFGSFSSGTTSSSGQGGAGASGSGGGTTGTAGAGGTGTAGGGGTGGSQCTSAGDCDTLLGPSPCGAWACTAGTCEASSPGCVDLDHDGYGSGAACMCAGLDCDDADPAVHDTASASCYSGPNGTAGVGTCQAGLSTCTAGAWGPCVGEVTPSGEACNGQDDDCNGAVDDGLGSFTCGIGACQATVAACTNGVVGTCVAGPAAAQDGPSCNGVDDDCDGAIDEDCKSCIPVTTTGNDATANGTFLLPFKTVQAAINFAASNPGPKTVCVAAGPACGGAVSVVGTYTNAASTTITMADGVSVLGNYESTSWTRCSLSNTTTVLQPQTPEGVTFGGGISKVTVLDGFRIDRNGAPTTAAVTVDGAKNAILSNLAVTNTPNVTNSYAIDLKNGAEAMITHDNLFAGNGTVESIGVRSKSSKPTIIDNCLSLDAKGHCDDYCGGANPAIRGRFAGNGPGDTYAVLLDDSPNALVQSSALCGNDADHGAGIRIKGDGAGIQIRANLINAWGGLNDSHGIWMEDCQGAAPWIVDNHYIAASGDNQQSLVDGIRAIGDCHPVIDSNEAIVGGGEGQAANPDGVYCGANAQKVASKCVVLGNLAIKGSDFGFPPVATGVRCDDGGCMKIANNFITGRGGGTSYGVWLGATGTFVDDNVILGGCSPTATGVFAQDSFARIQNNRIFGMSMADCGPNGPPMLQDSYGMHVLTAAGPNELDVHSNDIDGAGTTQQACTSRGVELDVTMSPPGGGVGIFRDDIVRAGVCAKARYGFFEAQPQADPRVFEHNDLDPFGAPTALYMDEAANGLGTAAAVDALADMVVNGTLSSDALFVNYPVDLHLTAASPCIGKGTPTGAPAGDMDGQPRDPVTPDIGADEH